MPSASLTFVLNLLSTWYMVGLIWMVQIVHYAMFDRVGTEQFVRYEEDHTRLITPIVAVPMLIELATAALLVVASPVGFPRWAAVVGLLAVVGLWVTTVVFSIPYHDLLLKGFETSAHEGLVRTNWIRTVLWSGRGALLGWFLYGMMDRG